MVLKSAQIPPTPTAALPDTRDAANRERAADSGNQPSRPASSRKPRRPGKNDGISLKQGLIAALATQASLAPLAAARGASHAAALPRDMLRQYQARQGTAEAPPHVVEKSLVGSDGRATAGRLARAMKTFSPNSIFDGLNLASLHSYGEPTNDLDDALRFNLDEACKLTRDPSPACVEYVPPTKQQAERINLARLAALKNIAPYIRNARGASKKLAPVIMVKPEWIKQFGGWQGHTTSAGQASIVRLSADLAPDQVMAMAYHEICHSHSHPKFRKALLGSGNAFLNDVNEKLTERIASEWTQVFDDMAYEREHGGAAFAECVIKLMGEPSDRFPRGGYRAGLDALMRAYFSGDEAAIEKCVQRAVDVGHWIKAHGDPQRLSRLIDEEYRAQQGIDIHHDEL